MAPYFPFFLFIPRVTIMNYGMSRAYWSLIIVALLVLSSVFLALHILPPATGGPGGYYSAR